jgi:hypothetical protein
MHLNGCYNISIPIILVLHIVLAALGLNLDKEISDIVSGIVFFITYSIAYYIIKKRKYVKVNNDNVKKV